MTIIRLVYLENYPCVNIEYDWQMFVRWVVNPWKILPFDRRSRSGQYSIRINNHWRVCFEWSREETGPTNVEIVDYH